MRPQKRELENENAPRTRAAAEGGKNQPTRIYGSSTSIKENDARPRPGQTRDARRSKKKRDERRRVEGVVGGEQNDENGNKSSTRRDKK